MNSFIPPLREGEQKMFGPEIYCNSLPVIERLLECLVVSFVLFSSEG